MKGHSIVFYEEQENKSLRVKLLFLVLFFCFFCSTKYSYLNCSAIIFILKTFTGKLLKAFSLNLKKKTHTHNTQLVNKQTKRRGLWSWLLFDVILLKLFYTVRVFNTFVMLNHIKTANQVIQVFADVLMMNTSQKYFHVVTLG